ncbi:MAG: anhydro-N-acetylmuramic acid kinase [Ottowia sp.]|nr:anhydro-N-acetylmuramic acid kinase [Ottowia sp.]
MNQTTDISGQSLYLGIMSGTSLDGIDGVLVDFSATPPRVLSSATIALPHALRTEFLALSFTGENELHKEALAANALAHCYADCAAKVLENAHVKPADVRALAAHGQTIRHQPGLHDGIGYTKQTLAPALLAELSGIDVIADFRSRDIAAGGQGAPLVPPFHAHFFGNKQQARIVCNIGGIANLTILPTEQASPTHTILGFDCGPGNLLLDAQAQTHLGQPYDAFGQWAASGKPHAKLLAQLMKEPFFQQAPPKSTGRDLFNIGWLQQQCQTSGITLSPQDLQATLTQCTVSAIAQAARTYGETARVLIVCGGGALNTYLMQSLQHALPDWQVSPSDKFGVPAQEVEACAFAWLGWQFIRALPGNLPSVTGARGPRILGAYYPH